MCGSISKSHGTWTEGRNTRLKLTNIDERCSIMWSLLWAELQKSTIFILTIVFGKNKMQVLRFINNLVLQFYSPLCLPLTSEISADFLALAQILLKMMKQNRVYIVLRRQWHEKWDLHYMHLYGWMGLNKWISSIQLFTASTESCFGLIFRQ